MIPPSAGSFGTSGGPWAGGFLHPLGVLFRRKARGRADSSTHWESRDAGGSQEFQGSFLPLSDGGIDWGTMHYFVPKRCVESNKIMYRDKATARQAADQSWRERGTELWVYRCEFCGTWHLTHHDPQSSYTYVPFNQQIKPHSRKKATNHVVSSSVSARGGSLGAWRLELRPCWSHRNRPHSTRSDR